MGLHHDITAPQTPAEAKRHQMIDRLWWICCASYVLLLFLLAIIWLADWPDQLAPQRLGWIGRIAITTLLIQAAIAGAFALGGPVGRWRARWGNKSFGADDDETAAQQAYDGGAG